LLLSLLTEPGPASPAVWLALDLSNLFIGSTDLELSGFLTGTLPSGANFRGRFNSGHRKLGLPAADSRLPDRNRHRRCPNHPTKQLGAKVGMFGSRVACRREQADGLLGAGVHPACGEPEIAGRARGFLWGV